MPQLFPVPYLRQVARVSMSEACVISTPGPPIVDDTGATTPGPPVVSTSKCRLRPRDGLERMTADQVRAFGRYELELPFGTAITVQSTVTIRGQILQVRFVPIATADDAVLRVGCEAV